MRDKGDLVRRAEDRLLTEIDRRLAQWRRDRRERADSAQPLAALLGDHDQRPIVVGRAAKPRL